MVRIFGFFRLWVTLGHGAHGVGPRKKTNSIVSPSGFLIPRALGAMGSFWEPLSLYAASGATENLGDQAPGLFPHIKVLNLYSMYYVGVYIFMYYIYIIFHECNVYILSIRIYFLKDIHIIYLHIYIYIMRIYMCICVGICMYIVLYMKYAYAYIRKYI